MSGEDRHILGSAEPLSPEQTEVRLRELEAWGVDLSLVWASLQQSPAQRLACIAMRHPFTLLHTGDDAIQNTATALYEFLSELEAYCPPENA